MNAQVQTTTKNGNGTVATPPASQGALAVRQPTEFERQLAEYSPQFAAALPSHIPVERFRRVVITAINQNPDLMAADRRSLFNACVRAANDGLLPDGREGALVVFNTKVKRKNDKGLTVEVYEARVQWMAMIQGILKRARNTGELAGVTTEVVYEKDKFRRIMGDESGILHEAPPLGVDRGKPTGAYCIVTLKDGYVQREVMTFDDIEKVRACSKAPNSLMWTKFWPEGARKSVARRCFKWLPTSADLGSLFDNDPTLGRDPADAATTALAPPRPTREAFVDAPSEPIAGDDTAEGGAVDSEQSASTDFELWSVHGEMVGEHADPGKYAQLLRHEMSMATTEAELEAVWEGNAEAFADPRLAEHVEALKADHEQFAANLKPKAPTAKGARQAGEKLV